VIDVASGSALPDRSVVINGNRIAAVEPSATLRVLEGVRVVEARGKYLIPGLWDMHVHMRGSLRETTIDFAKENEAMLALYVANGVAGVREMGGDLTDRLLRWRSEVERGERLGPRIATCGPKLDGPLPEWPGSIAISTVEQARAAVRRVKAMGFDFIKVYNGVPNIARDAYLAILDEAKRENIRVTGHVPLTLTVEEVSNGGQSIEHFNEYLPGCVRNEKELKAKLNDGRIAGGTYDAAVVRSFSKSTAEQLFERFAKNGTWVTPTLTIAHADAFPQQNTARAASWKRYLSPAWADTWNDRGDPADISLTLGDARKQYQHALETVRWMHKAGVEILAGSDTATSNAYTYPGFSLHEELDYLAEAGLTPLEALQCATINAARWLGRLDELGTVAKGKLADLVLLDANPLSSIRNTRKIRAVVMNGRFLDREDLDQMLGQLRREPDSKPGALPRLGIKGHLAAQGPDPPLNAHRPEPQQF